MEFLGVLGGAVGLAGWIWAIVEGFQKSGTTWGVINIIPFQPLIAIISAGSNKISWKPVLVMIAGIVVSIVGNAAIALR